MKITLFIGSLGKGGAERVLCSLADYLSLSHQVEILLLSDEKIEYRLNSNVRCVVIKSKVKNKLLLQFDRMRLLLRYIDKNRDNTYMSFLTASTFLLLSVRFRIRGKVFFSIRCYPETEYQTFSSKLMARILFPNADGIVFQTKEQKEFFHWIPIKNYSIISNSISNDFLKQLEEAKSEKQKLIISVGRLEKQKNFPLLIKSFAEILKKYKDYKLYIYGEGGEQENLQKLIYSQGIEDNCFLSGVTDNIAEELVKAEFFVSSSDFEGISNAVLEAMAAGIPVISTDWSGGGVRELIENEVNGLIIPRGDENKMVEAMERMITDHALQKRFGDNAKSVREKYDSDKIHRKWEQYMKSSGMMTE